MCNLIRRNTGFDKISPKFYLFIEKNQKLLLAAKKRSGNTTSNFIISLEKDDFEKNSENTIGKLRSNFMGTEFNIFDKGYKPSESKNYSEVRQQYGAILYVTKIFIIGNQCVRDEWT
jgi:tubby-related protein 1